MLKYFIAFISIALGSTAQYLFKLGVSNLKGYNVQMIYSLVTNYFILGGMFLYGLSLLLWFYVLSVMELSKAYPLISIGYIFTVILGYYLLNEPLSVFKVVGILLIVIGVMFISK